MTMLKYLETQEYVPSRLIDEIGTPWEVFRGDERDLGFIGRMTSQANGLAYYLLLESGIANNRLIPMIVRINLFLLVANEIRIRKAKLSRGAKFGLFANVDKQQVIRTNDCKFNVKFSLFGVNEKYSRIDCNLFRQTTRQQDTRYTDEHYDPFVGWLFDNSTGNLIVSKRI